MKLEFNFAINKPKKRIRLMGMPVEEMKLYGSKEPVTTIPTETLDDKKSPSFPQMINYGEEGLEDNQ